MATHSIFLVGKFQRQKGLPSCSQWGLKEQDVTERTQTHAQMMLYLKMSFSPRDRVLVLEDPGFPNSAIQVFYLSVYYL